jgi:hypothetical protein
MQQKRASPPAEQYIYSNLLVPCTIHVHAMQIKENEMTELPFSWHHHISSSEKYSKVAAYTIISSQVIQSSLNVIMKKLPI